MFFAMGLLRKLLVVLLFWFLLGPANIFAQSHNHEGSHQKESTSPFETIKKNVSLHCLLKLHAQHGICPHSSSKNGDSLPIRISSDCGGKNSGSLLNTASSHYDFTEVIPISLVTSDLSSVITPNQLFYHDSFNVSSSPPPRSI